MAIEDVKNLIVQSINSVDEVESIPNDPQPLRKSISLSQPPPIDNLPVIIRNAVLALHDITQAALPICMQSIIAAVNLAVQGHADIMLPIGQRRPISCFFISIAESGERKTSCDNIALQAFKDYESGLRDAYVEQYRKWKNNMEAWDAQKRSILADKKKYPDHNSKQQALDKLGKEPLQPLTPSIICSEPTMEGLYKLMQTGYPSLGLFVTEGGQFLGGYSMKEDNKLRTASSLSLLWDGELIKIVRGGDGTIILPGRRLSSHLMMQPKVSSALLSDHILQNQGLLSRFLIAAPHSTAGTRFYKEISHHSSNSLDKFHRALGNILKADLPLRYNTINELNPRLLNVEEEAKSIYYELVNYIESNIAPNKRFEPIKSFASKLPEHAARLAATFALFEDIRVCNVNAKQLQSGIDLANYYANEALRLANEGAVNPKVLLAERLSNWLHKFWDGQHISLPDIYQSLSFINTKAEAIAIVRILEDHNHLVRVVGGLEIKGRFRREVWRIADKKL